MKRLLILGLLLSGADCSHLFGISAAASASMLSSLQEYSNTATAIEGNFAYATRVAFSELTKNKEIITTQYNKAKGHIKDVKDFVQDMQQELGVTDQCLKTGKIAGDDHGKGDCTHAWGDEICTSSFPTKMAALSRNLVAADADDSDPKIKACLQKQYGVGTSSPAAFDTPILKAIPEITRMMCTIDVSHVAAAKEESGISDINRLLTSINDADPQAQAQVYNDAANAANEALTSLAGDSCLNGLYKKIPLSSDSKLKNKELTAIAAMIGEKSINPNAYFYGPIITAALGSNDPNSNWIKLDFSATPLVTGSSHLYFLCANALKANNIDVDPAATSNVYIHTPNIDSKGNDVGDYHLIAYGKDVVDGAGKKYSENGNLGSDVLLAPIGMSSEDLDDVISSCDENLDANPVEYIEGARLDANWNPISVRSIAKSADDLAALRHCSGFNCGDAITKYVSSVAKGNTALDNIYETLGSLYPYTIPSATTTMMPKSGLNILDKQYCITNDCSENKVMMPTPIFTIGANGGCNYQRDVNVARCTDVYTTMSENSAWKAKNSDKTAWIGRCSGVTGMPPSCLGKSLTVTTYDDSSVLQRYAEFSSTEAAAAKSAIEENNAFKTDLQEMLIQLTLFKTHIDSLQGYLTILGNVCKADEAKYATNMMIADMVVGIALGFMVPMGLGLIAAPLEMGAIAFMMGDGIASAIAKTQGVNIPNFFNDGIDAGIGAAGKGISLSQQQANERRENAKDYAPLYKEPSE